MMIWSHQDHDKVRIVLQEVPGGVFFSFTTGSHSATWNDDESVQVVYVDKPAMIELRDKLNHLFPSEGAAADELTQLSEEMGLYDDNPRG